MKLRIDPLNFFLIWICLGLALAWPFELFLFSYIVLGPLHYLTEINWLDKQNYFLRPQDRGMFIWTMVVIVAALAVGTVIPELDKWAMTKPIHEAIYQGPDKVVSNVVRGSYMLILLAFVMSAAWLLTERWLLRAVVMLFCLVSCVLFYQQPALAILFGVLLPTIIHVFFFTICFMLYGSLKAKSGWGYLNVISMFVVLGVIAVWSPVTQLHLAQPVIDLTILSDFDKVNLAIGRTLGTMGKEPVSPASPAFLRMQSFIAFAYTYHYLNWFSKTSVIKWHKVPKKKLIVSVILWGTSVGLFAVDYRLGFAASFALSVLHILLEFPLNCVSIHGIANSFTAKKPSVARAKG
jgi:hypothetical protein